MRCMFCGAVVLTYYYTLMSPNIESVGCIFIYIRVPTDPYSTPECLKYFLCTKIPGIVEWGGKYECLLCSVL